MTVDIEEKIDLGVKYFMEGYNCSQSVVLAYADVYNLPTDIALHMAASFGGGIGRQRLTCGTVSGMCMLAGMENGSTDPKNPKAKGDNYRLVQQLCNTFKERNGSITCADLLKARSCEVSTSPNPDDRNAKYYASRPCTRMVAEACRIFGEYLNSKQEE